MEQKQLHYGIKAWNFRINSSMSSGAAAIASPFVSCQQVIVGWFACKDTLQYDLD